METELPPGPRMPTALQTIGWWSRPTAYLERCRARYGRRGDELIFGLIEERRREDAGGDDVLALLLAARDEDGTPMSPAEPRDELVTALVAGHETTASQLADSLRRWPAALPGSELCAA
ncbi:MAG: hypothetical protein ACHP93_04165 [Solirubrobacterales bacterium]